MDSDESFINIRDTKQNYNGYTFLHHAVRKVNYKLIKNLIKKFNIDVKYDNNGNYPIHLAVDSGNLELVEYLCELGANLKIENSQTRRTPYELVQSDEIRTYFKNIVDIKSIAKSNFDELLTIINNCHRNLKMVAPIQWISSVSLRNLNFLTNLTEDYKITCSNYYLIYKNLLNNNSSIFNKDLPFFKLIKGFLILEDKIAHQNYFKILDISEPYYALKNVCPFY
jgi:ankyrin repeat protein